MASLTASQDASNKRGFCRFGEEMGLMLLGIFLHRPSTFQIKIFSEDSWKLKLDITQNLSFSYTTCFVEVWLEVQQLALSTLLTLQGLEWLLILGDQQIRENTQDYGTA